MTDHNHIGGNALRKAEVLSLTKHDNQGLRPEMTSELQ